MTQSLPEPQFIEHDPKTIEEQVFASWDDITEGVEGAEPLQPGSPEYLFAKLIAYREAVTRLGVQEASKLNLARFARFPILDYIGQLVGATRLDAEKATTTLQVVLPTVQGTDTLIPKGSRRKSKNGLVIFETTEDLTIAAGAVGGIVKAECTLAGEQGNGYVAGQISEEVDPLPLGATASNVDESANGAAKESDARYLERILLAPDAYTTGGSPGAYRFHALSADGSIADVAVLGVDDDPGLEPGEIEVFVLSQAGVPDMTLLDTVDAKLNEEKVAPMSDTVTSIACTEVPWALDVELTLFKNADQAETLAASQEKGNEYADEKRGRLGGALKHQEIRSRLGVYGVYDMVINSPAEDELEAYEWANCTSVAISVAGVTDYELPT